MLNLKKNKTFIIAEVGLSHEGSVGLAKSFIDAAAKAGADAIKFQTHIAEYESTLDEEFRIKFSQEDKTRFDYWRRTSFTKNQWNYLKKYSKKKKILFISSVFSIFSIELLASIGQKVFKVGSGEVFSNDIINKLSIKKDYFTILSSGLSTWKDIDKIAKFFKRKNSKFALLQCTSNYPIRNKEVGINVMNEMRKKYNCPVGLSDHSGKVFPSLLAMANAADLLEVHVTFDKNMFGPDVSSSITFKDLKFLCKSRDEFHEIISNPINKNKLNLDLKRKKNLFGKSIALKENKIKGYIIKKKDIIFKKPATGINESNINKIIGKKLKKNYSKLRLLKKRDLL